MHAWIADGASRSTVKNSLTVLVRVMEQAHRDGIIDRNPAQVRGWQREYRRAEDERDDPRSPALPHWPALVALADALVAPSWRARGALVARSWRARGALFAGWGWVVTFGASTAARIGQVSGVRVGDIDTRSWMWTVRRQTTPSPGGLADKSTKGRRSRQVPLVREVRELVTERIAAVGPDPMARLFTGPRGGRITTAVLRDATILA